MFLMKTRSDVGSTHGGLNHETNSCYSRARWCEYSRPRQHVTRDDTADPKRPEGSGSLKYVPSLLAGRRLAWRAAGWGPGIGFGIAAGALTAAAIASTPYWGGGYWGGYPGYGYAPAYGYGYGYAPASSYAYAPPDYGYAPVSSYAYAPAYGYAPAYSYSYGTRYVSPRARYAYGGVAPRLRYANTSAYGVAYVQLRAKIPRNRVEEYRPRRQSASLSAALHGAQKSRAVAVRVGLDLRPDPSAPAICLRSNCLRTLGRLRSRAIEPSEHLSLAVVFTREV